MFRKIKRSVGRVPYAFRLFNRRLARAELDRLREATRQSSPDSLTLHGYSVYSQADEDGILEEILRRLGASRGVFVEIGVGNGLENNTAYLLAKGWRGAWAEAQHKLAAKIRKGLAPLLASGQLTLFEQRVDPQNVKREIGAFCSDNEVDVFSLDIDGYDLHVAKALFDEGFRPKVAIVEYNAAFPPPLEFVLPYEPNRSWRFDDHFGASYTSWSRFFAKHGYTPVACSSQGSNLFLVRNTLADAVRPARRASQSVFLPPRYDLAAAFQHGHTRSYAALCAVAEQSRAASAAVLQPAPLVAKISGE